MGKYEVDLLDGFDGREIVYDEKKERSYHARIWWALLGAAVLILLRGVTFHIDEIKMQRNWKTIEADYSETTAQAVFIEENGIYHQYDLAGFDAAHHGDKMTLYYEEDVAYAQAVHELSFWIKTYFIFGLAILFTGWRLWVIYRK